MIRSIGGSYEIQGRWPVVALAGLSFLFTLPLFAPWSFWPAGYVAFVPWLIAICIARRGWWAYLSSYGLGAAYFLFHFRWLADTTVEGYVAASLLYLAWAFVLAAWPIRHLYRRRNVGAAISFPVVWAAVELLRTYNPLSFPWFFLGHSQIRLLSVIQIADFAGVIGVSFVVAMVNGWFTDLFLQPILLSRRKDGSIRPRFRVETITTFTVLAAALLYGRYRLAQTQTTPGPSVAVLQGDYLLRAVPDDPEDASDAEKQRTYLGLTAEAVAAKPGLDLLVLPETPWTMYLNREFRQHYPRFQYWHDDWVRLANRLGKSIVVGGMSEEPQPKGTYPDTYRYNSAFLYTPGQPEPQRYNKIHLVPFGECVPFRYSKYLHWLYRWLAFGSFNPWGRNGFEYSLTPGSEHTVFTLAGKEPSASGRFGVTICYEDVIPQVFRKFVATRDGRKRVDFMLNISNDGWFGHGNQQPQHLVNCAFRAVENRVGIARAVNTGVSGFVDSNGTWRDLVMDGPPRAGGTGFRVANVQIDSRVSFYSIYGDVFGTACLLLTAMGCIDAVVWVLAERRDRHRADASVESGKGRH